LNYYFNSKQWQNKLNKTNRTKKIKKEQTTWPLTWRSPPGSPLAGPALCWPVPATCFLSPGRQRGARPRTPSSPRSSLAACLAWTAWRRLEATPRHCPDPSDTPFSPWLSPSSSPVMPERSRRRRLPLPRPPPSPRPMTMPSSSEIEHPIPTPKETTRRALLRRHRPVFNLGTPEIVIAVPSPLSRPRAR